MKRIILLLVFITNLIGIQAQATLIGNVEDLNKKPISFANVVLFTTEDSTYVAGSVSDENGTFSFDDLNSKEYKIEISFLGYTTITDVIEPNNTGVPFTFTLVENAAQLGNIIVEGKRKLIIKKTDRIIVDIENSMRADYGNAVDVLSVTPGLKVQNNQLQMLGKSEITVLINDRPSNLTGDNLMVFLETLGSQDIKSIEIMTSPPAEYDGNGNGGIINIILKEAVSNSWKANIGASFRKRTAYKATGNAAFTYNKDKFFITNSFYLQEGIYHQGQESTSFFEQEDWFSEFSFNRGFLEYNNRLNVGYQFSSNYAVNIQYLYSHSDQSTKETPYSIITEPRNGTELGRLNTDGYIDQYRNIHSINFNQSIKIDTTGKQLSINLDYFGFNDIENKNYEGISNLLQSNTQYFKGNNINDQKINNKSASFDFRLPFTKFAAKFGGRLAHSSATNSIQLANTGLIDFIPTNLDPVINDFEYKESVRAIYASVDPVLPKGWSTSLGLRFESVAISSKSNSLVINTKKTLNSLLPTVFVTKQFNPKTTLGLSYNRRISRPSFYLITPNPWITNPFLQVVGNPFLLPSFSDHVELSLTHNNFYAKVYHTKVKDAFSQIPISDAEDKTVVWNFINFPSKENTGITLQHSWELSKRWTMNNTADLNYGRYDYDESVQKGVTTYFATSHDLILNKSKTLQMSIDFWYSPRGIDEIWVVRPQSSLSTSFQYKLLDGKLLLGLRANDIFKNQNESINSLHGSIGQDVNVYYDSRFIGVTVNYNFGDTTIKDQRKESGNKDELRRTGN